ncbi:MAG: tripartite tricarboxylate transporter TctB family protein [Trueperaceae bacterium]|nr:tripartite tricarboxylate transporter TctB family protein [Trueperaceae bacterium]
MSDRISGVVLLAFTVWFGVNAWSIERGFFSDPLGSRPFPLAVAILMAPLALYLVFRPLQAPVVWPVRSLWPSLVLTLAAFLLYSFMMEPFGFIVSNVVVFFILSLVFRATPLKGLIAAVVATLALYVLFGWLLELYLPTGELFEGWFR